MPTANKIFMRVILGTRAIGSAVLSYTECDRARECVDERLSSVSVADAKSWCPQTER